jgi:predicted transcriptional regulator
MVKIIKPHDKRARNITITLRPDELREFDEFADAYRLSRSMLFRLAVRNEMMKQRKQKSGVLQGLTSATNQASQATSTPSSTASSSKPLLQELTQK